ncbi:hypothetical protein [Actinoplanes regularis]|uniref:hypothetical protein n=1 Tax=Actinoplanes regularis TaxID=52697 RepID=UPI0024A247D4|nr:hypothetical protein [Actinoplanes regularis]GLW33732.1 hypothetical protein Areg01_66700 [Actinoplanes regularis]
MSETSTPARSSAGTLLQRAAEMERATWRSMYLWLRGRHRVSTPGHEPFGYVGVIKPILMVFIVLSAIEVPVFDLIVTNVVPWRPARWIVLVLGVWGLLWMLGFLATMTIHPHVVGAGGIRVRHGASVDFTVAWDDVESVRKCYRSLPTNRSVQFEQDGERRVLNVGVGKQTNIDVRLRRPMTFPLPNGSGEPVDEIRLYADDADGFPRGPEAATAA